MIFSVLFVCFGNICRSPMAEGMLRNRLPNLRVESAGIAAVVAAAADPIAIALMSERGIDISLHRARQITTSLCRDADLILVMNDEQKKIIVENYMFTCGRVYRLGQFGGFDVPDPYLRAREHFASSANLIEQGVHDWTTRIHAM